MWRHTRKEVKIMKILIKGGWVVDSAQNIDEKLDILIAEGKIQKLGKVISEDGCKVIDADGKHIFPGLIDMHVHFRDPGFEQKETIETGSMAAVAGGFTSVVCMPNTKPVIDNFDTINYIKEKGKKSSCNVYMMGSITKNLDGTEMSNYEEMKKAGILGITDDGKTVTNTRIMYEAMQKAKDLDLIVSVHCEDKSLEYDRTINQGEVSKKLNLEGVPALAEEIIILRDIFLAEKINARVHIQHISTKRGVELVKAAKDRGIKVTCEATPHHFTITDKVVMEKGSYAKMSPPLRTNEDMEAIAQALIDGTIDVIATDHAPHTKEDKDKDLVKAMNGIIGLETSLGLALTELVHKRGMELKDLIKRMSYTPAQLLNLPKGTLKYGYDADITIVDLNKEWIVDKGVFQSKSENMPFENMKLKGKAVVTIVGGKIKHDES